MHPLPPPRLRQLALATALLFPAALGAGLWLGASPVRAQPQSSEQSARPSGAAFAWLKELQATYSHREVGTPKHRDSVAFIASSFTAAGAVDVEIVPFHDGKWHRWNVLGRIPGRDPSRAVVLAAHHDVVPGAPGAIDDGGGLATIVAAISWLVAQPPACDVIVASYDGEEYGDLGSKQHVEALNASGRARVSAALAVELVGWTQDKLVVHTIPYGFAWDAPVGIAPAWIPQAVRSGARALGAPVGYGDPFVAPWYQATIRVLGVRTGSDAGAFTEREIPAAMLTGSALTNFYRGYHRPNDDMTQVDPAKLEEATRAVVGATVELAARSVEAPRRAQGEAYLMLGERTLTARWLTVIGLLALLPLLIAGHGLRETNPRLKVWAIGALVGVGGLALAPSVIGVLSFAPWVWCLGLTACAPRFRRLIANLGLLPFAAQVLLIVAASQTFGFRWRAGALESTLLGVSVVACMGWGWDLIRARVEAKA